MNEEKKMIGEKYRIIKEVGAGGGGCVFQVHDCRLDKVWAAKKVDRRLCSMEEQVMQSVESVSLVRIVDAVEQDGERYLIMDWVEGESLQQRIDRKGALPAGEVVRIGIEVCRALEELHGMEPPILYLDCKPSNILLEQDGRVLLADFGSAVRKEEKMTTPVAGSVGYTPPEQRRANPKLRWVDERSDVYSLGKTLYAALGGQCPDRPPYGAQRLRRINSAVPAALCRIVEKCSAQEPVKRYQTAKALRLALERYESTQKKRVWIWRGISLGLFLMLAASAWEVANWIQQVQALGIGQAFGEMAAFGVPAACKKMFRILKLSWAVSRHLQRGSLWAILACVGHRLARTRFSGGVPEWEVKQSVLRMMKNQGLRCVLLMAVSLWMYPLQTGAADTAWAADEDGGGRQLFGLRDEAFRKLLLKDGAVLEADDRVYIELDPVLFENGQVYEISVSGVDERGEEEQLTFLYCAKREAR